MKKIVTTLLLSIVSLACIFAFTACDKSGNDGNGDNKQQQTEGGNVNNGQQANEEGEKPAEIIYTVTESEWEAAFGLLSDGKTSWKCIRGVTEAGEGEFKTAVEFVGADGTLHLAINYNGEEKYDSYYWIEGGTGYFSDADYKYTMPLDEYNEAVLSTSINYADGMFIETGKVNESFNKFIYDETKKVYTATLPLVNTKDFQASADTAEFSLHFENGKLIRSDVLVGEADKFTCEYSYDIAYFVPDSIKSLPLWED